ncbi:hypothetical protein HPP92_028003 [Vanilla planifolia]|uniref:Uncharacterized protein n=1 Tax=Vanilla planifolia TaxID=51239 RepID=A0A835U6N6_VANPL|nr:hypothetical protein HPP92_028003 [Vanilla planifolia]
MSALSQGRHTYYHGSKRGDQVLGGQWLHRLRPGYNSKDDHEHSTKETPAVLPMGKKGTGENKQLTPRKPRKAMHPRTTFAIDAIAISIACDDQ